MGIHEWWYTCLVPQITNLTLYTMSSGRPLRSLEFLVAFDRIKVERMFLYAILWLLITALAEEAILQVHRFIISA